MKIEIVTDVAKHLENIAAAEKICIPEAWSRNALCDFLSYDYNSALAALADGEFAAYLTYSKICDEIQIANVATLPEYRRNGIADAILDKLKRIAKSSGVSVITLEVRSANTGAISLYKKHGFSTAGTRKGYYKNPADDALLMNLSVE